MLDNCFARAGTLAATICASYQEQMVTQLYKLFFSIELLGNPRGLFTKMATGVTDAFYEPMAGLVRGPEEFAHGVLVSHVIVSSLSVAPSARWSCCGSPSGIGDRRER